MTIDLMRIRSLQDSVISGDCNDPFAILGQHEFVPHKYTVNCFLPNAKSVTLLTENKHYKLNNVDNSGFFTIELDHQLYAYKLSVVWKNEVEQEIYDPYCFQSTLTSYDKLLFTQGKHLKAYQFLGAHYSVLNNISGVTFMVWAPNAKRVSVVGDFNLWDGRVHQMRFHVDCGIWEIFIPDVKPLSVYKYEILDANKNIVLKADPYAFFSEFRPETASVIFPDLDPVAQELRPYEKTNTIDEPISIYEVHLASWANPNGKSLYPTYQELTEKLIPYAKSMGFTHLEILPIHEYPYDGSWGYQPIGLYSPTSRFGNPYELQQFVKAVHDAGLKIILDWVPGHFPTNLHGLAKFDGTCLYEYEDTREGFHKEWNTLIYNYKRLEVRNYLASNAIFYLDIFDFDGLRVDAVASMIYKDYARNAGEWVPNEFGGHENLEAIDFLKYANEAIHQYFPDKLVIAEDSTAYPGMTLPPSVGGVGYNYKWNIGWMNDTLKYMQYDPIYRRYHHNLITFDMLYHYSANFVLAISHDEVVHGKRSLMNKMPGDFWQKFANLRAYFGYMWGYPGKKLIFMGSEFGQYNEWDYHKQLDWHLLDNPENNFHVGVQKLVKKLNYLYRANTELHALSSSPEGFAWLIVHDNDKSVFAFSRKDAFGNEIIVINNFTPEPRDNYYIGVDKEGHYDVILNTDDHEFMGSGYFNASSVQTEKQYCYGKDNCIRLNLPPLATLYLQYRS